MVTWKQADADMAFHSEVVVSKLLERGHEAYWVGGCVRDELMGRPVHDMDITTSALPEEVETVFERTVPTGIKHGTVTVLCGSYAYEVTTYRVEGAYENHRRPAEVEFVSDLKEDLKRRDFTINAIARAVDGTIVDPFGGTMDLSKGLVRCVGNARTRFQEDALRMVRCIRFASVFGFGIAYRTWRAMLEEREGIRYIAMERFRVELEKLMDGSRPYRGLLLLHRSGLLKDAKIPFTYEPDRDLISMIDEISPEDAIIRWAMLLYACGLSAEGAHNSLRSWTFANILREQIAGLLSIGEAVGAMSTDIPYQEQWVSVVLQHGRETAERWLFMAGYITRRNPGVYPPEILKNGHTWTREMEIYHLSELSVTGKDLMDLSGRRGGPWVGEILGILLVKVASRILPNDREILIDEVKRVINT
ncbi:CCA tRNA nucleotidyltransferase [Paenibacillus dokdonensis]|uniref:CCA tRNA nucleotidyltransferase n=1 Tax=Paenibacillus dokdonensis TaxID=2567944 RepID=A0ABU6GUB0_9BACL|nr:CCA tRNA nucleotidyltransferase [Paenibacillus dokdonensis]MEC0243291.1 CCA tRNA nucleotidyltransferase [Paenibacillus dokdonensis]